MVKGDQIRAALAHPLEGTNFEGLGARYVGKVRDNYTADGRRTLITTDRVSAFDRVLGTLPLKGQVLNWVAAWWFERTRDVAPNHVISVPDPNVLIAHECRPLPVEMVMRSYLTGTTSTSVWSHYERGERVFCGHSLPDGLKQHQKLSRPILTPSTKAAKGDHDVSASRAEILEMTGMPEADFDAAGTIAEKLFAFGQKLCAERGIILVDTKYEFGKTPDGTIVVIDEIHTPDSSRFWFANSYDERIRPGPRAGVVRQGVLAPLLEGRRLHRRRPDSDHPGRREGRGGAPLHRRGRDDHRRDVRAQLRGADRADAAELEARRMTY